MTYDNSYCNQFYESTGEELSQDNEIPEKLIQILETQERDSMEDFEGFK